MKIAVCGKKVPQGITDALSVYADELILLPPYERLGKAVQCHADMLIFPVPNEAVILTHSDYYSAETAVLDKLAKLTHRSIETISEIAEETYPNDILLNALTLGNTVIGRRDALSTAITNREELKIINTKQGYAKCNACKVSENAVITEDVAIKKAIAEAGFESLAIKGGIAELSGYDYGFIGGASGNDSENVFFCGDIASHPDYEAIKDFCKRHGKGVVGVRSESLTDIGSVFFFEI